MKLNAIGVTSSNLKETVRFYELLGFKFPEFKKDEDHLEPISDGSSTRLMIDSKKLIQSLIGEEPRPSNHSAFALEYENPQEVNEVASKVKDAGFKIKSEPWDAFWGQRYCIVIDPDGYLVDLYSTL
jgi:catechol 2,3-dioxygenase-like lactoylglutathione lyase family enzyme